jgi:hypothetical protein
VGRRLPDLESMGREREGKGREEIRGGRDRVGRFRVKYVESLTIYPLLKRLVQTWCPFVKVLCSSLWDYIVLTRATGWHGGVDVLIKGDRCPLASVGCSVGCCWPDWTMFPLEAIS